MEEVVGQRAQPGATMRLMKCLLAWIFIGVGLPHAFLLLNTSLEWVEIDDQWEDNLRAAGFIVGAALGFVAYCFKRKPGASTPSDAPPAGKD